MPELWSLNDAQWVMPIIVEWNEQKDVGGVTVAEIPMLSRQRDAVTSKLTTMGNRREGRWWIVRKVLEKSAAPAAGTDPESVVVWKPIDSRLRFRGTILESREEFFKEYSRTGIIRDPVHAEIIFVSFTKHILHTLLNLQKPVDLGFCELCPVPYRPNWKQLVMQGELEDKFIRYREVTPEKLINRFVADRLLDPKLLFWCASSEHIYWSLEVRPKAMWWKMVKAVEEAKKKKHKASYAPTIADTMKRMLPHTLKLYASFLQQISLPWVRLFGGRTPSRLRALPKSEKFHMPVEPDQPRDLPASFRNAGEEEPHTVLDSVSSDAFLSTLQDIQPPAVDVRIGADGTGTVEDESRSDSGPRMDNPHGAPADNPDRLPMSDGLRVERAFKTVLGV